jgi:UDP-N-acetylglucosamine acyltransferase
MIHATAVIHPAAHIDPSVTIGAHVVVDEGVTLGPRCVVGPHVHLTGHTTIGEGNRFHSGCVIGDAPQDLKYAGEPTRLRIGAHNTFREHVTVHRSNKLSEDTVIGSHNLLMAGSHVGHNTVLGDHVILVNGAMLAGHVTVGDRAFISGSCLVHQFVRIGALALMQGGAAISLDLPPGCIAAGVNGLCGLNAIGLRRAGVDAEARRELKRLYHLLFRSGRTLSAVLAEARAVAVCAPARQLVEFVGASRRGVLRQGTRGGSESEE